MALRERTPFLRSPLECLLALKLLATASMRNASIDLVAATELGILVCGAGGSNRSTMELTWGLILPLVRHIPREDRAVREGPMEYRPPRQADVEGDGGMSSSATKSTTEPSTR